MRSANNIETGHIDLFSYLREEEVDTLRKTRDIGINKSFFKVFQS